VLGGQYRAVIVRTVVLAPIETGNTHPPISLATGQVYTSQSMDGSQSHQMANDKTQTAKSQMVKWQINLILTYLS